MAKILSDIYTESFWIQSSLFRNDTRKISLLISIIFARILVLAFVSAGLGRGQFELIDGFKTILSQREQ